MKILAVIPARYAAQRLPGKPLAMIGDRPMVQWVYEAAKQCHAFEEVVVATESEQVAECIRGFGGKVEMTRSDHLSGTDRVAEVAARYEDMDIIANVQGDLPFVTAKVLNHLVSPYLDGELPDMTTLAYPLSLEIGYSDPNVVKVILDRHQNAIYFSRSPIPNFRNPGTAPVYHHLGLYAFRRDFLVDYAQLTATPLELCEGLEQLRVLENGYSIRVCQIKSSVMEVNTSEDLDTVRSQLVKTITS
ncbi:MAG TPA: 3-deoxy-manno-octulosonate cytidylyltransferase [Elainellaceae cyanobacterium]